MATNKNSNGNYAEVNGSSMSNARLAILSAMSHYAILRSPAMVNDAAEFLTDPN